MSDLEPSDLHGKDMSVIKVGLNQPIMREVLEKLMISVESDVLTE